MTTKLSVSDVNHRANLADKLDKVGEALGELYTYWIANDLPADMLGSDEYPFQLALEDQLANVAQAGDRIRQNNEARS